MLLYFLFRFLLDGLHFLTVLKAMMYWLLFFPKTKVLASSQHQSWCNIIILAVLIIDIQIQESVYL